MFQPDDMIIYGSTGVCRVDTVGSLQDVRGTDPDRQYYTLMPVYGKGTIYAPVDSPVYMRPVLTRQEAEDLVDKIPSLKGHVFQTRDQRQLTDQYQASFESHCLEDLLQLIMAIRTKNELSRERGKKPGQVDQRFMKRAEDLLYGELSVVLGVDIEAVPEYITTRVASQNQSPVFWEETLVTAQ